MSKSKYLKFVTALGLTLMLTTSSDSTLLLMKASAEQINDDRSQIPVIFLNENWQVERDALYKFYYQGEMDKTITIPLGMTLIQQDEVANWQVYSSGETITISKDDLIIISFDCLSFDFSTIHGVTFFTPQVKDLNLELGPTISISPASRYNYRYLKEFTLADLRWHNNNGHNQNGLYLNQSAEPVVLTVPNWTELLLIPNAISEDDLPQPWEQHFAGEVVTINPGSGAIIFFDEGAFDFSLLSEPVYRFDKNNFQLSKAFTFAGRRWSCEFTEIAIYNDPRSVTFEIPENMQFNVDGVDYDAGNIITISGGASVLMKRLPDFNRYDLFTEGYFGAY